MFWANDNEWFHGVIDDYHPDQGWHCQYFDGDEEWLTDLNDKNLVQFEDGGVALEDTGNLTEAKNGEEEEDDELLIQEKPPSSPAKHSVPVSPKGYSGEEKDGQEVEIEDTKGDTREILGLADEEDDDLDELEAAALAVTHAFGNEEELEQDNDEQDNDEQPRQVVLDEELQEDINDPNVAFDLPERGVIMMGHITNASNLPQPPEGEADGRVFFRILYVEGSSKSTMFRCKTPVYTSKEASDLLFPEWKDAEFRFEMVMPVVMASKAAKVSDVVSAAAGGGGRLPPTAAAKGKGAAGSKGNKKAPADRATSRKVSSARRSAGAQEKEEGGAGAAPEAFVVQGEILVALYRARAQGGSDFVGQVTFDLAELASSGTTQYPSGGAAQAGVQARSTHGSYPIVTRSGAIAGDGMAHVDVAFELIWRPEANAGAESGEADSEEAAAAAERMRLSLKGKTPQQKKGKPSAPKEKEKPKFKTFNAKRKLMEAHRIEKENKTLAAALRKHATKGQNKYRSVDKAENVYSIPRESLISGKDPPKLRNEEEEELYQFQRKVARMGHAELMQHYVNLKKTVAQRKADIASKTATASRLRLQAKKYGLANDKMKRKIDVSGGQIAKGAPYASEAMKAHLDTAKQQRRDVAAAATIAEDGEDLDGDGVVSPEEAAATREALEGGGGGVGGMGYAQYVSIVDARSDLAMVDDPELREHLQEHAGLQQARAHLVARIQAAKLACQKNLESLEDAKTRERVARARLGSAFSKLGNKYAGLAEGGAKVSEEDRRMDEDLQAIERVRGVALELARTEAMFNSGVSVGPMRDSTEELLGMERRLNAIMASVRDDVGAWKEKKAATIAALSKVQEERVSSRLRQQLGGMREKLLAVCRQQKVLKFSAGADSIELEALRMQLRRQQKGVESGL